MTKNDIKPCLCGRVPIMHTRFIEEEGSYEIRVENCLMHTCSVLARTVGIDWTSRPKEEIVQDWNRLVDNKFVAP